MISTIGSVQSNGLSNASSSSLFLAKAAAKREISRLPIRHLPEERDLQEKELENQQQRERDRLLFD